MSPETVLRPPAAARGPARRRGGARTLLAALAALLAVPASVAGDPHPLDLRINDLTAVPGGIAAIVLRTYESRPIGQGQVCLRINGRAFASAEGSLVTSLNEDARHRVQPVDARTFTVQFLSPSGSINAVDGPLAVLYLQVREDLVPGQTFRVGIDVLNTFLTGADGAPISFLPTPGELTIRDPAEPMQVEADGDEIEPGEIASLFMETREPLPLSSGSMGMRFDPAVAAGSPVVRMGGAYGNVDYTVDDSVPGLVIVSFQSPDGSLGRIPGGLVQVDLPTLPDVPPGLITPVVLDPELTALVDAAGQPVPIRFESATLEFE